MAKYTVIHICGHDVTYDIAGKTADRQRKADWYARQPCAVCRRAAEAADVTAANAAAGLPALTGSPKQVAWAEKIRNEAVQRAAKVKPYPPISAEQAAVAAAKAGITAEEFLARRAHVADGLEAARAVLYTTVDAAWWIENRTDAALSLFAVKERLVNDAFAAEIAAAKAAQKAKEEAEAAARAKAREEEQAARAKAREEEQVEAAKLVTFVVGDRADSVTLVNDTLTVHSRDGRVAKGYVDHGDWVIYDVAGKEFPSWHPEAERIAREARAFWQDRR